MKEWTSKQIINFRKKHKLSQPKLGEMVGVSKTAVYQWERGERTPSRTAKILLCRIEEDCKKEAWP